ncbi:DNA replication licensing factor mcm3 [Zancudomyces culisetae]|uniref:DNA replication licensing factor MCM3 n=1 Tax=Zancudomyces culisetae TaxID=1213189 RepID=A0A1R1PVS3_ZANCU|nr:DNA replication licensing factor mcm3 [Zancudomyces culisetae]|eukprot:OMH85033.1 DNA replication licensing factor mcm3 [Zancudomyces culisetae]
MEFLNQDYEENKYRKEIQRIAERGGGRLIIDIDVLRDFDQDACAALLRQPAEYIPPFEAAATQIGRDFIPPVLRSKMFEEMAGSGMDSFYINVGFIGSFGDQHVSPRKLEAKYLGRLLCIEGIVTRTSLVRPKIVRSVHYSERKETFYSKQYMDQTTVRTGMSGMDGGYSTGGYPKEDDEGNPLTTEYGLSVYSNHQTINVQEMPERAPPGQLPRGVDVILDKDLVDNVKPGDRVLIVGIYRALASKSAVSASGIFRSVVIATSVHGFGASSIVWRGSEGGGAKNGLNNSGNKNNNGSEGGVDSWGIGGVNITEGDMKNIREVSQRKDVIDLLSRSLAPSICGQAEIKKALLLLLLGGIEKNLENGGHIRGDINMLMVGDPSTAKSQVLRYVLRIAPLAIATTGRGSSGVGLTAAVTTDKDTGERRLEAGAMVLGDRGVVCIDEFDKMTDGDRVAIHEAMEQQTVTIAKAGIHTTLNARCSVVAAANPIYGRYDPTRPPHQNIALPDSLLSRFDLLFIVTDVIDEKRDRDLSTHVLKMHQHVPAGIEPGQPIDDILDSNLMDLVSNDDENDNGNDEQTAENTNGGPGSGDCVVFEQQAEFMQFNSQLSYSMSSEDVAANNQTLSTQFLRRYLHYAKVLMQPVLTDSSSELISSVYAELRAIAAASSGSHGSGPPTTSPVTPRTLETLIRLATAHAKARLSNYVEEVDAEAARDLLQFALFREYLSTARSALKDDVKDQLENMAGGKKEQRKKRDHKRPKVAPSGSGGNQDMDSDLELDSQSTRDAKSTSTSKKRSTRADRLRDAAAKKYHDLMDVDDDDDDDDDEPLSELDDSDHDVSQPTTEPSTSTSQQKLSLSTDRFTLFKSCFQSAISQSILRSTDDGTAWSITDDILPSVNAVVDQHQHPKSKQGLSSPPFSSEEVLMALDLLQNENRVFVSGDSVYLI